MQQKYNKCKTQFSFLPSSIHLYADLMLIAESLEERGGTGEIEETEGGYGMQRINVNKNKVLNQNFVIIYIYS